jgi:hypothetical protein
MKKTAISDDARQILDEAEQYGSELHVDLLYPRSRGLDHIVVGLTDVRSADSIRISYDFERDGWKIEQASMFSRSTDDKDWQEVVFVQAWARERWECNDCSALSDHDAMKCSGCGRARSEVDDDWGIFWPPWLPPGPE